MSKARELVDELRADAQRYIENSKAYRCRTQSETRAGFVTGAKVFELAARRLEAALDADEADQPEAARADAGREPGEAPPEGKRVRAGTRRKAVEAQAPGDHDQGSVHLQEVRSSDD